MISDVPSLLEIHQKAIIELCERFAVRRLEAFGSVLRADFRPESDVDLLVQFSRGDTTDAFEQFFGFKEALEKVVGREVDLIVADAIRNDRFRAELDRTKAPVYVAA